MSDKELIEEAQTYIRACREEDYDFDPATDLNTEGAIQDAKCQSIVMAVDAKNISPKEAKRFVRKWSLRR